MTDTLILFKPLAEFGEALKKECPNNDCVIYRNVYERYCEEYADYNRIKEAFADLSEATVRALEHAIRTSEKELYAMWFENYAVLKQRAALGMAYGNAKPKRATQDDRCELIERHYEAEPQSEEHIKALQAHGLTGYIDVRSACFHGII